MTANNAAYLQLFEQNGNGPGLFAYLAGWRGTIALSLETLAHYRYHLLRDISVRRW